LLDSNTRSSWENVIAKKMISCKMLCFRITCRKVRENILN